MVERSGNGAFLGKAFLTSPCYDPWSSGSLRKEPRCWVKITRRDFRMQAKNKNSTFILRAAFVEEASECS
jgi:hypothetical protein